MQNKCVSYKDALVLKLHRYYIITSVDMEEQIKLLILIILTIYTYTKFRSLRRRAQELPLEEQDITYVSNYQLDPNDQQLQYKLQLDALNKIEFDLFPPTIKNSQPPETKANTLLDCNDVLGGQYSKCISGRTFDMDDSIVIYNKGYFNSNPFRKALNQPIKSNQDYLNKLKPLLSDPLLTLEPISNASQTNSDRTMIQQMEIELSLEENNNSNVLQISDDQNQHEKPSYNKKKTILKKKRFFKRTKKQQNQKPQKLKPLKIKHKSKKQKILNLQDIIRQKEQQVAVLKRLRKNKIVI